MIVGLGLVIALAIGLYKEDSRYFTVNSLFTLFHELGHASISEFDLPVLGREEDAADQLATLLLRSVETHPDFTAGELTLLAAKGWLDDWKKFGASASDRAYGDEHSLEIQRYDQMACLTYGSDPGAFPSLPAEIGLPEDRANSCVFEYAQVSESWERLLAPHYRLEGSIGGGRIGVVYEDTAIEAAKALRDKLVETKAFDTLADAISDQFVLPRDLTMEFTDCGTANAFWAESAATVTMCYELLVYFSDEP